MTRYYEPLFAVRTNEGRPAPNYTRLRMRAWVVAERMRTMDEDGICSSRLHHGRSLSKTQPCDRALSLLSFVETPYHSTHPSPHPYQYQTLDRISHNVHSNDHPTQIRHTRRTRPNHLLNSGIVLRHSPCAAIPQHRSRGPS